MPDIKPIFNILNSVVNHKVDTMLPQVTETANNMRKFTNQISDVRTTRDTSSYDRYVQECCNGKKNWGTLLSWMEYVKKNVSEMAPGKLCMDARATSEYARRFYELYKVVVLNTERTRILYHKPVYASSVRHRYMSELFKMYGHNNHMVDMANELERMGRFLQMWYNIYTDESTKFVRKIKQTMEKYK